MSLAITCVHLAILSAQVATPHPWKTSEDSRPLVDRIAPPSGFERLKVAPGGFGAWLRDLPALPGRPAVRLFDGREKANQTAHQLVLDIDVGVRNLQQCADAAMRLRAEYLWSSDRKREVCFRFTSGDAMPWTEWAKGIRPKVKGNKVRFGRSTAPSSDYATFRRYLDQVFLYAGSASLEKELVKVELPSKVAPGDVFIQGGFPGHAVIVVDVAENDRGERVFLIAQSFMPAQQIHILRGPTDSSPWYPAKDRGELRTPEWVFDYTDLHRFGASCSTER